MAKGTFVRVAEADAERVTLDGGQQFAHADMPCHHLRELPGADAPRPGVAAGRGHAALQPAAPVRWRQPGHQLRAVECALDIRVAGGVRLEKGALLSLLVLAAFASG